MNLTTIGACALHPCAGQAPEAANSFMTATKPTPRISVVSAYRFHMFELARQLDRLHALQRLVTATPRRTVSEVPLNLVRSRSHLAVLRHAAIRLTRRPSGRLNRLMIADFDRWATRQVEDTDLVVSLSSFGTKTLNRAATLGAGTVCDRGSWHILEQKRVLDAEADRWGWPPVSFDPWIIDRELADYELADRIFVPSEQARQSFIRRGTPLSRLAKLPYGVDVRRFTPSPERNPLRVISIAHIGLRKGHQYLVPAYRRARRPGSTLVLVGHAERFAVERLAICDDDITATGPISRDQVASELRTSGVFVLASVEEGLALVIAQAMAAGLPVVATDATGASELVTHGVEGLIVPSADEDALTLAIDRLLGDPEQARAMGQAGRERVLSAGGWNDYGAAALEELTSIAECRNKGRRR